MSSHGIGLVLGVVGVGLYLCLGVLYLGAGLVMPYPWAFAMWVVWFGGLIVLARVFASRRLWTPAVAVAGLALWVVTVLAGEQLFGWTA
ncbi:MAG: hypothetical protein ACR2OI_08665 [Acidimicrobiia bacterium]